MSTDVFMNTKIFGAYDVRGKLDEVTPEVARRVAGAFLAIVRPKVVIIGRDMRSTSEALAQAVIAVLTGAGVEVRDIGLCSTSMFSFAVARGGIDGGIMITASHNPAEYNGIKTVRELAKPVSGKDLLAVLPESVVGELNPTLVTHESILEIYLEKCLRLASLPDLTGMKIVVDYGNGMGSVSLSPLLSQLGIEVTELYKEPDARFPNHEANPAKPETFVDLSKKVVELGADLGIATDGDADRIGFVDERGEILRGDQTLALLAVDRVGREENLTVAAPTNVGWSLDSVLREHGIGRIGTKVGWAPVSSDMRAQDVPLGGELSDHFFYREFEYRESVDYTCLLMLALLRRSGQKLSELAEPTRRFYNSGEVNLEIEEKAEALQKVRDVYGPKSTDINDLDGVRMTFGDEWWFILRPSNTEPILRLVVEAGSKQIVDQKIEEIKRLIL